MVMVYFEEMKAHILQGESEYNGTGSSSLPVWTGSVQKTVSYTHLYRKLRGLKPEEIWAELEAEGDEETDGSELDQ